MEGGLAEVQVFALGQFGQDCFAEIGFDEFAVGDGGFGQVGLEEASVAEVAVTYRATFQLGLDKHGAREIKSLEGQAAQIDCGHGAAAENATAFLELSFESGAMKNFGGHGDGSFL